MLKLHELTNIQYTKQNGDVSDRSIIPTYIPEQNLLAIDVTQKTDSERQQILALLGEYKEYVDLNTRRMLSFDAWLDHTQNASMITSDIEWRKFNMERVK